MRIQVEGEIEYVDYQDPKTGEKKKYTNIKLTQDIKIVQENSSTVAALPYKDSDPLF
jgi:hypothetical protein